MAEIKIEKKKPIWPWIAVVLIIGALLYYILVKDHDASSDGRIEIDTTSVK